MHQRQVFFNISHVDTETFKYHGQFVACEFSHNNIYNENSNKSTESIQYTIAHRELLSDLECVFQINLNFEPFMTLM
jgi:hypothetical protein